MVNMIDVDDKYIHHNLIIQSMIRHNPDIPLPKQSETTSHFRLLVGFNNYALVPAL